MMVIMMIMMMVILLKMMRMIDADEDWDGMVNDDEEVLNDYSRRG